MRKMMIQVYNFICYPQDSEFSIVVKTVEKLLKYGKLWTLQLMSV